VTHPGPGRSRPFEDGCRASEPAIAGLLVAVIDLRSDELVTVIFGDATTGYACWSLLGSPEAPLEVRLLEPASGPADGIDAALYEPLQLAAAMRVVLIGRVGPMSQPREVLGDQVPARVIAQLGDEAFITRPAHRGQARVARRPEIATWFARSTRPTRETAASGPGVLAHR
jgi:hypothetical protein